MTVHNNSVIPIQLNTYHSSAYEALTNQENYCYTKSTKGGYTEYRPFFSNLASAISTWFSVDRTESARDLIEGAYVYVLFGNNFGTSMDRINELNAYELIDMEGLLNAFVNRPEDYYDDYYNPMEDPTYDPTTTGSEEQVPTAPRLEQDVLTVKGAPENESSRLISLGNSFRSVANKHSFKMLFDPPQSTGNAIGYEGIAEVIFLQNNWKGAFHTFNIDLELPSYI